MPAGARVEFAASAVDVVDGKLSASCSPASGTTFAIGTRTVSCSATDRHGNRASGQFAVTVRDTTGPRLRLPADPTAEARSRKGASVRFAVSATDLVSGPLTATCSRGPGLFPLGTTTVSCSAVDERGQPLERNVPRERRRHDGSGLEAARRLSDPSELGLPKATCTPASGYVFSAKDTRADASYPVVISCEAVDAHGNRSSGSFTVTVTVSHVE